jgi:hypothetical protein
MDDGHLRLNDSRQFLRELSHGALVDRCVSLYLDAHWSNNLPLLDELELIVSHWSRLLVMVDGFKIPDDPGYGHDDYGKGKVLALETLEASRPNRDLVAFFPRSFAGRNGKAASLSAVDASGRAVADVVSIVVLAPGVSPAQVVRSGRKE